MKSFALINNPLIEKLYDLHTSLSNSNRLNLTDRFPLYKAFCIFKEYKRKITSFTNIPLFLFPYETISFIPASEIIPLPVVESIRWAPCLQLVFRAFLTHLIDGRHLIFTDASRRESGDYVGVGIYFPIFHIREMLRVDHNSSVFSGECIAVIRAVECVLENGVGKVTIFSDSRSVIDIVSSNRIDRDFNYLVLVLSKLQKAN